MVMKQMLFYSGVLQNGPFGHFAEEIALGSGGIAKCLSVVSSNVAASWGLLKGF